MVALLRRGAACHARSNGDIPASLRNVALGFAIVQSSLYSLVPYPDVELDREIIISAPPPAAPDSKWPSPGNLVCWARKLLCTHLASDTDEFEAWLSQNLFHKDVATSSLRDVLGLPAEHDSLVTEKHEYTKDGERVLYALRYAVKSVTSLGALLECATTWISHSETNSLPAEVYWLKGSDVAGIVRHEMERLCNMASVEHLPLFEVDPVGNSPLLQFVMLPQLTRDGDSWSEYTSDCMGRMLGLGEESPVPLMIIQGLAHYHAGFNTLAPVTRKLLQDRPVVGSAKDQAGARNMRQIYRGITENAVLPMSFTHAEKQECQKTGGDDLCNSLLHVNTLAGGDCGAETVGTVLWALNQMDLGFISEDRDIPTYWRSDNGTNLPTEAAALVFNSVALNNPEMISEEDQEEFLKYLREIHPPSLQGPPPLLVESTAVAAVTPATSKYTDTAATVAATPSPTQVHRLKTARRQMHQCNAE